MRYVDRRTVAFMTAMAVVGLTGVVLLVRPDGGAPAAVASPSPTATAVVALEATGSEAPEVEEVSEVSEAPSAGSTPTATPTPTVDPTEAELAELRESEMWEGLAEWDRAGEGRARFEWVSESECAYASFSNAEAVWNQFAPALREELLLESLADGITASARRFPGTAIEDDFVAGALAWWTNNEGGTQGRGTMFNVQASYRTSTGEPRVRQWPVLIGHGTDPNTSKAATLRAIGPPLDLAVHEIPDTYAGTNEQFNDHHFDWLLAQPAINPPVDPPLPEC